MEFEFTRDSKAHKINIEKAPKSSENDIFMVAVDGIVTQISASRISENCAHVTNGKRNFISYFAENDQTVFVHLNGHTIELGKMLDVQKRVSGDLVEFGAKDEVSTPMPGKVVKILVSEGETVKIKQPLVIVESMKMENEIKSPTDGTVKSIHFKAGDLVSPGQAIIKLEPNK